MKNAQQYDKSKVNNVIKHPSGNNTNIIIGPKENLRQMQQSPLSVILSYTFCTLTAETCFFFNTYNILEDIKSKTR